MTSDEQFKKSIEDVTKNILSFPNKWTMIIYDRDKERFFSCNSGGITIRWYPAWFHKTKRERIKVVADRHDDSYVSYDIPKTLWKPMYSAIGKWIDYRNEKEATEMIEILTRHSDSLQIKSEMNIT